MAAATPSPLGHKSPFDKASPSKPTWRTPEEVTAILERSREVLGRVSPVQDARRAPPLTAVGETGENAESFTDEASAALSELSGEVLGLSAVIVRQQQEAGQLKTRQQRTEEALRVAEERMRSLEKQCAGFAEKLNLQALEHARRPEYVLLVPLSQLSCHTQPIFRRCAGIYRPRLDSIC